MWNHTQFNLSNKHPLHSQFTLCITQSQMEKILHKKQQGNDPLKLYQTMLVIRFHFSVVSHKLQN